MTPETSLTPETISEDPGKHSGNSGRYIIPELLEPAKPDPDGHLRILLGQRASDHLTATGESAFIVIGKASHPDDPSRWVIHLVPLDMKTATAACNVALGTHRAVKIKDAASLTTGGGTTGTRLDTTD
jgi:hypothetical protein